MEKYFSNFNGIAVNVFILYDFIQCECFVNKVVSCNGFLFTFYYLVLFVGTIRPKIPPDSVILTHGL